MPSVNVVRNGPENQELRALAGALHQHVVATLLERLPAAAFIIDEESFLTTLVGGASHRNGIDPVATIGRNVLEKLGSLPDAEALSAMLAEARAGRGGRRVWSGGGRSYELSLDPLRSEDGRVIGVLGTAFDMTAELQAKDDLQRSNDILERAERLASFGTWSFDILADRLTLSRELRTMFGFTADEPATREDFLERIEPEDRERIRLALSDALHGKPCPSADGRIVRRDGTLRWLRQEIAVRADAGGRPVELNGTALDIDDRKMLEQELLRTTHFDPLTGLPNRVNLIARLEPLLEKARQEQHAVALLCIDLDKFNAINETYGHDAGDAILEQLSRRIAGCLRTGDFVARSAGDEFTVVMAAGERDGAAALAKRILALCAQPFAIAAQRLFCAVSIGLSIAPEDTDGGEQLIHNADSAMRAAKDAGGNGFRFFTQTMHAEAVRRHGLESDLQRAIERDQFFLAYQPVLSRDGSIESVEALMRWRHPIEGTVPPSTFIPLAEKSSLMRELGAWVAHAACAKIGLWRAMVPGLRIALNVSARQFDDPQALLQTLADSLIAAGIGYTALDIEVTESLFVSAPAAVATLRELRAKGARVSLDNFGTGYSSLAQLKRLPIDTLKIDRSFVSQLDTGDQDADSLVAAVIAVAKAMGLETVAEGVETNGQYRALEELGCNRFQGYLFSRPVGEDGMAEILQQGRIVPQEGGAWALG